MDSQENQETVDTSNIDSNSSTDSSSETSNAEETTNDTNSEISVESNTPAEMSTSYIAMSSVHFIISIILIFVILQQSKNASAISSGMSGTQTYWSKNKGRTRESQLVKITIILSIIFFFVTLALNFIN